ncbi:MAG: tyrosine-type recombinase/integrase, partial [Nitrospirales bacterium]|nr:tyrosine-type recombinase/integrase [Nitrospirales bacterium]
MAHLDRSGTWNLDDTVQPDRVVPRLNDTSEGLLQHLLNEEARAILRSFPSWKHSTWVFPSKTLGTHLDPCNFYGRVFLPAVKAAKLEGVTWHSLRHTFASRLAMNGHSDSTIAA